MYGGIKLDKEFIPRQSYDQLNQAINELKKEEKEQVVMISNALIIVKQGLIALEKMHSIANKEKNLLILKENRSYLLRHDTCVKKLRELDKYIDGEILPQIHVIKEAMLLNKNELTGLEEQVLSNMAKAKEYISVLLSFLDLNAYNDTVDMSKKISEIINHLNKSIQFPLLTCLKVAKALK